MLDTALQLETPEGSTVDVYPAGFVARAIALLLDEIARWLLIAGFGTLFFVLGDFGAGLYLLSWFLVSWFYGVVFEVFGNGATPGKRAQGLKVIHDDGTPIRLPASLIRNLLLVIDFLPVFYVTGLVSMSLTARFCRLGDLVAGTLVVYQHPGPVSQTGAAAGTSPAPIPLSIPEQAAMVDFLERAGTLSEARVSELAAILKGPLKVPEREAVETVKRIAAGIRGEV